MDLIVGVLVFVVVVGAVIYFKNKNDDDGDLFA